MTTVLEGPPANFQVPSTLDEYDKSPVEILERRSAAKGVAVGAFVFAYASSASGSEPRLLLIQREHGDGRLADKWEVPGGGCEPTDATILHSTARELFEEAGLHMTGVVGKVGGDHFFTTRSGLSVVKLSFEVQVQEVPSNGTDLHRIPVRLSHEHQNYAWATEEEIRTGFRYPATHDSQLQTNLEAFARHRAMRGRETQTTR